MSTVLQLKNVGVRRSNNHLLSDFSVTVEEGQHWAVLGPNGAGKTTFLELAAGRMHPTEGTVDILGERLGRVDVFELRPRIGYTSSQLAKRIPGNERVRDVIVTAAYGVLGRWVEEYDDIDLERADDLLSAFDIGDLGDRRFGTLSDGEKKRVQISRSLMTDPELLLFDEPATGLDLGGREELMRALSEIIGSKYAPTTVMVTHHVEEIPTSMTHALLIRGGRVVAAGEIADTVTEENLTETFGVPIELTTNQGRFHAQARLY